MSAGALLGWGTDGRCWGRHSGTGTCMVALLWAWGTERVRVWVQSVCQHCEVALHCDEGEHGID